MLVEYKMINNVENFFKYIEKENIDRPTKIADCKIEFVTKDIYKLNDLYKNIELDDKLIYIKYTNSDGYSSERCRQINPILYKSIITDIFFVGLFFYFKIDENYVEIRITHENIGTIYGINTYDQYRTIYDYLNDIIYIRSDSVSNITDINIIFSNVLYNTSHDISYFINIIAEMHEYMIMEMSTNHIKIKQIAKENNTNIIAIYNGIVDIKSQSIFGLKKAYQFIDNITDEIEKIKYGIS